MRLPLIVGIVLATTSTFAAQPLKVTIRAEGVGMPEGTVCRAEVRAEYRIVQPRVTKDDAGRYKGLTDDMATFRAVAPERHTWSFVGAKGANGRQSFEFTLPAGLPRAQAGARSAIYVPITYTIAVPGFPEVKNESTYVIRFDNDGKPVSRCLRFELINNGQSLRTGLLPTCEDSFEKRGGTVLMSD